MTPFARVHHPPRRFNSLSQLKTTTHHPNLSIPSTSIDLNNNNNNSSNTPAVLAHYEHSHADSLLEALNDLRLNRHLCDVTIIVDQHQYPCHKVILSHL